MLQLDISHDTDADSNRAVTKKYFLDPTGQYVSFLYGVTVVPSSNKGTKKLYFGSVNNNYIGALSLDDVMEV